MNIHFTFYQESNKVHNVIVFIFTQKWFQTHVILGLSRKSNNQRNNLGSLFSLLKIFITTIDIVGECFNTQQI